MKITKKQLHALIKEAMEDMGGLEGGDADLATKKAKMLQTVLDDNLNLDDYVKELKDSEAYDINRAGPEAQIEYMIKTAGLSWVMATILVNR